MNIQHLDCGFPYILVDEVYDKDELDLIWEELDFISCGDKMDSPEDTGSAKLPSTGKYLKNNKGLFLDQMYNVREVSNILNVNRKIFTIDLTEHPSWFWKSLGPLLSMDTTLVSYYENNDFYDPHTDLSQVTILYWIYREPKKFEGGDLYFPDYETGIRVKNNRAIIFPSFIEHGVTPITMEKIDDEKLWGRYCITNFVQQPLRTSDRI